MTLRRLWTCESLDPFRQGNSETKQNHESIWIYCHIAKFCRSSFCGFPIPELANTMTTWWIRHVTVSANVLFIINHWTGFIQFRTTLSNQNKSNKPINQSINHSLEESHRIHPIDHKDEKINEKGKQIYQSHRYYGNHILWEMLVGRLAFPFGNAAFSGNFGPSCSGL